MKLKLLITLFSLSMILPACQFKCSIGDATTDEKTKPVEKDGMALYNGIELSSNKVKVNKAYLVTNDDKRERISEGNFISLQTGVRLVLLIDSGWKETDGRVWLGASMTGTADNGEKILGVKDLFASYDQEGISAEDAKILALSVNLSEIKIDRPVSFDISFRVWDKKSEAFIEGAYRVHTK